MSDKPMHKFAPAEHAAMGWAHGQYKDGYCLAVLSHADDAVVAEFSAEAASQGAEYVALFALPEYRP